MSVQVISIEPDKERLLGFLYPEYSVVDSVSVVNKFIVHRDVTTKREREVLDFMYDDCIFISSQIFDEVWDEAKLKEKVIEFSRKKFKSRKTKFDTTHETFVDGCINFMFGITSDEQEQQILSLFDSFGSASFNKTFMQMSMHTPLPVLCSAMNTFVTKSMSEDGSVYYKKKHMVFGNKIKANMLKAVDELSLRDRDNLGLSSMKFYNDLFV